MPKLNHQVSWEDAPDILYKYKSFGGENYGFDLIQKPSVYFASPMSFNDPFDFAIPYDLRASEPELRKWMYRMLKRTAPLLNRSQRKSRVNRRIDEIKESSDPRREFYEVVVAARSSRFGVCSLTPNPRNLLMWPHYADNHTGYCIGFSKEALEHLQNAFFRAVGTVVNLYKVEYAPSLPAFDFFESMEEDEQARHIMEMLCIKSDDWEYEEEYRLILLDQPGKSLMLKPDAISEVILGIRISDSNKDKLLSYVEASPSNIKVYEARRDLKAFDLKLNEIAT